MAEWRTQVKYAKALVQSLTDQLQLQPLSDQQMATLNQSQAVLQANDR